MEKKVVKVGNLSTGNSQAGTIYGSWGILQHYVPEVTDMPQVIQLSKGKIKEITMNKYTKIIDNCLDCDRCSVRPIYTADSWEHEEGAYCKEVIENGKEKLIVADDWDLRKYSKIPDWCPKLIKSKLNDLRIKAEVGSNKKFDEKLNELLKDQSEEYSKLIRTLISMGFAYEQVVFERDVAIAQLNMLGIQFGEDIKKYKVIKE